MVTTPYREQVRPEMHGAALSDVGRLRQHNEDKAGIFLEARLAVVVDGMGGHSSGDFAAQLALDALADAWGRPWPDEILRRGAPLELALELANLRILASTEENQTRRGQGAAAAVLAEIEGGVLLGHVGDCRIYRLRDGKIEQMTEDHSLLNEYARLCPEPLTPEQLAQLPRNVITRALGMKMGCGAEVRFTPRLPGDQFLLCSDGLSSELSDEQIAALWGWGSDDTLCVKRLVEAANEAGGRDNISVVLVRW